jgi:outer membrane protein OmpA-like peptidoglycan-associated protein
MFGLNVNVNKSTIENLEQSLKIKKSYGFSLSSSSGHFSEKEKEYMRYVADCLKMNPEAKVSVVGYTCDLGTKMINEELGFDRAIHVRNYLIRYGAFEEQVEMDSQSTHNPVAPNTSEKNREKNRRTEIKLIKKK